jgi:hypothetical protein
MGSDRMNARFWGRVALVWLAILVLAILNGALREAFLLPAWGRPAGLVASGVLLAIVILAVALASARWIAAPSAACAWRVGIAWLLMTLAFEFGFGALVQRRSLAEMLAAYTFRDGNLWPLVLGVTLLAPVLARRARP